MYGKSGERQTDRDGEKMVQLGRERERDREREKRGGGAGRTS